MQMGAVIVPASLIWARLLWQTPQWLMRPWQLQCVRAFPQIDIIIKEPEQGLNHCRFTPLTHARGRCVCVCVWVLQETHKARRHPSNSWAFPSVPTESEALPHWLPESVTLKLIGVGFKQISSSTPVAAPLDGWAPVIWHLSILTGDEMTPIMLTMSVSAPSPSLAVCWCRCGTGAF